MPSSLKRQARTVAEEVAAFRAELAQLHNRAGRPSKREMAEKAGRPPTKFGFLDTTTLPTEDEVLTFLVALEQPTLVADKFRNTRKRLELRQRRELSETAARSLPSPVSVADEPMVVRLDTQDFGALTAAKAAQNGADFSAALNRLRSTARLPDKDETLSFNDMAKASGGRLTKSTAHRMASQDKLPAKMAAVEEYVRACGATEQEVRLWTDEYQRLKRGEAPPMPQHALAANSGAGTEHRTPRCDGILAGLTSTEDFAATDMGLSARKLILFLSAAIADDTGSPETTYRAVLLRGGSTDGHWASGMDLRQLTNHLDQYLGRRARKVPLWPMIRDLVETAVREPEARAQVLADAAGLYNQVTGTPPTGYATTAHLPWWGYPVTGRTQTATVLLSLPQAGRNLSDTELEMIALKEENAALRQALDIAIRGFRELAARSEPRGFRELPTRSEQRTTDGPAAQTLPYPPGWWPLDEAAGS